MYFPESDCPFYRATIFSNYSSNNAPEGHWSLMVEVSETEYKTVDSDIVKKCLQGAFNTKLLNEASEIVSKWHKCLPFGYPIPTHGRKRITEIDPILKDFNIWSRGRFGSWKYEVGNMDHSFMQGVEAVDNMLNILTGTEEITYNQPDVVNQRGGKQRRFTT